MLRRLACLLAALCPLLVSVAPAQEDASDDPVRAAELARSQDPDDPAALEALSLASGEAGDADGELAYLLLAIDGYDSQEFDDEAAKKKKLKELEKRLKRLDKGLSSIRPARDSYLRDLTWALKLYARNQNKHRNALEMASRILDYRPDHPSAGRAVEELMKELSPALMAEARRLLFQKDLRRPLSFLRRWAEEHDEWSEADTFESERYVVKTNAGYEVGQIASKSLSAIADYFQDFYGVDRSLVTERTPVLLTKTWAEFKEVANNPITDSPGLLAFIATRVGMSSDGEIEMRSTVYGFDPRDRGRPLSSLWPTLWHEASHEYMAMACEGRPSPAWFNEGMSSYFEGATFSETGEIGVGLPARSRLDNLYGMLSAREKPLKPAIQAIDRLTGAQYAVVWGIIYHLRHGRDADGKLLRPGAIEKALELLREKEWSSPGLFEAAVLSHRGETLEEFEAEWSEAMKALHVAEADPVARAQELASLGKKRFEDGDPEDAATLYSDALLRDPGCFEALEGLVEVHRSRWIDSRKRDDQLADEVLYWARRLYESHRDVGDEEGMEAAVDICTEVDRAGHKRVSRAEARYREQLEKVMGRLIEGERPRTAIAVARLYVDDVLGTEREASLARELREDGTLALEREFVAFDGTSLTGWSASPDVVSVDDGTLVAAGGRPFSSPIQLDRALSRFFRFEGDVMLEDGNTIIGVTFSCPEADAVRGFVMRPKRPKKEKKPELEYEPFDRLKHGRVQVLTEAYDEQILAVGFALDGKAKKMKDPLLAGKWSTFSMEVTEPGVLVLSVNGEEVARTEIPEDASSSSIGLLVYGGRATMANMRAVELDAL